MDPGSLIWVIPAKATMPFVGVSSALDKGHETALILSGDATLLFKDEIANGIQGLGMPPLKDLMATAVQANVYMAS